MLPALFVSEFTTDKLYDEAEQPYNWESELPRSLYLNLVRSVLLASIGCMLLLPCLGCNSEPAIYPITGKITIGGESHERLIVYMRPIDQVVNQFNMGVGETDSDGNMKFGSAAGDGLAAGKYRVSFSFMQMPSGDTINALNEKVGEDGGEQPMEMVPSPYDYKTNADTSPLEFEVEARADTNQLIFDIPSGDPNDSAN